MFKTYRASAPLVILSCCLAFGLGSIPARMKKSD